MLILLEIVGDSCEGDVKRRIISEGVNTFLLRLGDCRLEIALGVEAGLSKSRIELSDFGYEFVEVLSCLCAREGGREAVPVRGNFLIRDVKR